jgi:Tfp pilus assembly protein PilF
LVNYSRRAIDLFPNQPTVYLTYGIGLSQQGKNKEAIEYLKLGKDLVIDNQSLKSQFYSSLGDCYHSIKDNANSDENYNQALELDPNNVIVLNNYSYYLSVRKENLALAKTMSAKSNKLAPNQASFQDTYAWILFQLKEYDDALIWIEKATENSPAPSGEILEHKGDILFKKNDLTEAVEYWKKAKLKGGASLKIDKKINDKTYYE